MISLVVIAFLKSFNTIKKNFAQVLLAGMKLTFL